jgi:hypothetical protein
MSERERLYKALKRQGELTRQELENLKADLLQLIDGKAHPKSQAELTEQLVRFCGWNYHVVNGPRPYVNDCLERLESEGLIDSRVNPSEFKARHFESPYVDPVPFGVRPLYWKRNT